MVNTITARYKNITAFHSQPPRSSCQQPSTPSE